MLAAADAGIHALGLGIGQACKLAIDGNARVAEHSTHVRARDPLGPAEAELLSLIYSGCAALPADYAMECVLEEVVYAQSIEA